MVSQRRNSFMGATEEDAPGSLLRTLREERGWSQQEVAARATRVLYPNGESKVWQGMISNYERGQIKNPGPELAQALDTVFDLPPGTLFGRVKSRGAKRLMEATNGDTLPRSKSGRLAEATLESQDILIEMLADRFERAVDALLRSKMGVEPSRPAVLAALFELYDEGILTKGEVRRRGNLEPEAFYDELRAYRKRRHARAETLRALQAMDSSSPDDPDNDRFPFNVPTTFSETEGREIERIMEQGAPAWVQSIRERLDR